MIIKCHACDSDSAARWKTPARIVFHDPYAEGAGLEDRNFLYACRSCLSPKREKEIQAREADHWPPGGLR